MTSSEVICRLQKTQSAEDAPLKTMAVARQVGFNRKTLKKYGLDAEIARASEEQRHNGRCHGDSQNGVPMPTPFMNKSPKSRLCGGGVKHW